MIQRAIGILVGWVGKATAPALLTVGTGLVATIVMLIAALGVQTWRLGQAHERNGALRSSIEICAEANRSQMSTIGALQAAQEENDAQRRAALAAQAEASKRARQAEQALREAGNDDIRNIERSESACGNTAAPADIRMRVTRGRDQNGNGRGNPGTPGPD